MSKNERNNQSPDSTTPNNGDNSAVKLRKMRDESARLSAEFDQLKKDMQQVDENIQKRESENVEISQQISELENILRRSVTDEDFIQGDDALKELAEVEQKLENELRGLQQSNGIMRKEEEEMVNRDSDTDKVSDDADEGEEPTEAFKRDLNRTMSNDVDWNTSGAYHTK